MVVDEEERVIGIISLSDLLQYLVLRPQGEGGLRLRTVIEENAAEQNTKNTPTHSANKENTNSDESSPENIETAVENDVLPTVPDCNKISTVVEVNTDPQISSSVDVEECSEPLECEKSTSPEDESKNVIEIAEEVTDANGIDSSTNDAEN